MAAAKKPNILFIMGDDIGWFNISAYNLGVMGYRTPNIDRIAREGALFTDWYGQQSCTAGRAAFITGQSPIRTGLTKVGLPGADIGLRAEDPSVADVMKSLGYVRADPLERGDESILYNKGLADHVFIQVPAQTIAAKWIASFKDFPPRQKPASFSLDDVMAKIGTAGGGRN
jgi:hypothetical protein